MSHGGHWTWHALVELDDTFIGSMVTVNRNVSSFLCPTQERMDKEDYVQDIRAFFLLLRTWKGYRSGTRWHMALSSSIVDYQCVQWAWKGTTSGYIFPQSNQRRQSLLPLQWTSYLSWERDDTCCRRWRSIEKIFSTVVQGMVSKVIPRQRWRGSISKFYGNKDMNSTLCLIW